MKPDWAEENLQTIRTLMERSALYRRALAPIMIYVGSVGTLGGIVGTHLNILSARAFVLFWFVVAAVSLIGSFLLVRRQCLKNAEPFWSPPTRRVAQALIPPFTVGTFVAMLFFFGENWLEYRSVLILVWCWAYGCAIHSAGFFMPRGFKFFGWIFILAGFAFWHVCGGGFGGYGGFTDDGWMGVIFGGLHLAYGIYLYFTEKKTPVA